MELFWLILYYVIALLIALPLVGICIYIILSSVGLLNEWIIEKLAAYGNKGVVILLYLYGAAFFLLVLIFGYPG